MSHWIRYTLDGGAPALGRLAGGRVEAHAGELFGAHQATGRDHALAEVQLLAPCAPGKVIALWNNFHALGQKLGKAAPAHPLYLIKPATSVTGPGAPIRRPARYDGKIVFEGELGIVIGRPCRDADEAGAAAAIFGYTCVNDVTAAQWLDENPDFAQWTRAKGPDTFCCLGPAIATDLDWQQASVRTLLDGAERQNYPLADMIFSPQQIVQRISGDMTLMPGDVIACGTSIGVGSMKDGAQVTVCIEGIGALSNQVVGR
jgi:2-keto-4-pentenoate hydratase/2-oxohepta-3-ene-1,7-dioic acid hydratase in catechol pathway